MAEIIVRVRRLEEAVFGEGVTNTTSTDTNSLLKSPSHVDYGQSKSKAQTSASINHDRHTLSTKLDYPAAGDFLVCHYYT
jgi:hypothetical protein